MKNIFDLIIQLIFILYYRIHLLICFITRPTVYGSYVAVWSQGKILIIKNSYKSFYTVPCGSLDSGELPEECASRELFEEVGIEVNPSDLILFKKYLNTEEYKKDNIYFYEIVLDKIPEVVLDNREVIWGDFLAPDHALGKKLFTPVRQYILEKRDA